MKIVIPGGTGHVGASLRRHFVGQGHEVVIVSRSGGDVRWDGRTLGTWVEAIDCADVVINLAGRSVNCRYGPANMQEMLDSRLESTRVVGEAIAVVQTPPKIWLQSSTATIYADRYDAPNDELDGIIGGHEPNSPPKWVGSIKIALAWEAELAKAATPRTRKVAMRSAMTMSPDKGSIFDVLCGLTKRGLGGKIGNGKQFISWIHEIDFCNAIDFVIADDSLSGPINFAAPEPLPQAEFQRILRESLGVKIGLPATKWMAEMGAYVMGTETELIFKSRRVIPRLLMEKGFGFQFADWQSASRDLVEKARL